MAIARDQKEKVVEQLKDDFGRMKLTVLTDYRGLSVAEIQELRRQLKSEGMDYRVTKNTLLKIAIQANPALAKIDPGTFTGPMALAIGFVDEVAPARVVYQYAKEHDALEIVGALTSTGELLTPAQVNALATLPTKEQLLAQLVGQIAAPASGLVGVMVAQMRSLLNVLGAINTKEAT